ncbi:MAG TPA: dNTP triphosphohydrolase [Candidatus Acidoferrales bacterium]|nr:dNTP triphosphohydrolase [Candidatus Acidoferrales bacterium]
MSLDWSRCLSSERAGTPADPPGVARTPFQRDYDRILFSASFRRLADKTQVFPLPWDDHVHSRLTHSLEVASIGRSLGTLVGARVREREAAPAARLDPRDFGDSVAAACLAHDLGNPPFGHVGESAIREFFAREQPLWDELSARQQRDLLMFEGNAQTFRIVTRLERPTRGHGLDLTFATLGALVKYPCSSASAQARSEDKGRRKPGLLDADVEVYAGIARGLGLSSSEPEHWPRHPLALLTEAADDIAYLLLDLEDGLRLGHVSDHAFVQCLQPLCEASPRCPELGPLEDHADRMDRADRLRAIAVDALVHDAADAFMAAERDLLAGRFTTDLRRSMRHREAMLGIQQVCEARCYRARDVLKMELSGAEAIQGLLEIFVDALRHSTSLRAAHLRRLYPRLFPDAPAYDRLLRFTDHVSGMTDHYAVRLYRELRGMRYPGGRD